LLVKFRMPEHVGGPIKYFEILQRQNGKLGDIVSVPFQEGEDIFCENPCF
jgi:hypothetical protein